MDVIIDMTEKSALSIAFRERQLKGIDGRGYAGESWRFGRHFHFCIILSGIGKGSMSNGLTLPVKFCISIR